MQRESYAVESLEPVTEILLLLSTELYFPWAKYKNRMNKFGWTSHKIDEISRIGHSSQWITFEVKQIKLILSVLIWTLNEQQCLQLLINILYGIIRVHRISWDFRKKNQIAKVLNLIFAGNFKSVENYAQLRMQMLQISFSPRNNRHRWSFCDKLQAVEPQQ